MRDLTDDDPSTSGDGSTQTLRWNAYGLTSFPDARSFAHVTTLNLSSNGLLSLRGVERLRRLRAIDCSGNRLTTLDDLRACGATLRAIDARDNAISTTQGLGASLPRLRALRLGANALRDGDARVIDAFASLVELDVSDNGLETIPDARHCPALRIVSLRGNALRSLARTPRALPAALVELDVSANDIADVEELRHLKYFPRLAHVRLRGNPLEARAVHYGYDARAVAAFCLPSLATCDGARAAGSSWSRTGKLLFRNDDGELCDDLLALLTEGAPPWALGEYLRSACGGPPDDARRRRRAGTRGARGQSAMFSVSSFVPVRENDDEDKDGYGDETSDDDGSEELSTTFAVEAKRVYGDESPGDAAPPAPLDSTADWLSRVVSESDEEDDEDEEALPRTTRRLGEALTMISPIRSTTTGSKSRRFAADSTTDEDATTSDEFHSLESVEDLAILRPTPSESTSASAKMRLVRASPSPRESIGMHRRLAGVAGTPSSPSGADSPDLRPLPLDGGRRGRRRDGSFVFTDDDSDSFAFSDEREDEREDEESLRSFLLTGDERSAPNTPRANMKSSLRAVVADLTSERGGGGTPERLAACAKKIEGMITDIKRSRARAGDYAGDSASAS